MRLKSRLAEWQKNDLISAQQTQDITLFEKDRIRDLFHAGLKYTALFAILLGISLIVAANWDLFPVYTRLGAHILLNTLIAGLIWHWTDNPTRRAYREGAVYLLAGLTLTLLALIGQSFQLQGDIGGLLILWLVLITGLVIMAGDHERIARFWFLGFVVTFFVGGAHILDQLVEPYATCLVMTMAVLLPLALWGDGHIGVLRNINESFADMLIQASFIAAVVAGFAAGFIYYEGAVWHAMRVNLSLVDVYRILAGLAVIAAIGFAGARMMFKNHDGLIILAICAVAVFIPFVIPMESHLAAAVHFIILALSLGIAAMYGGHYRLMNLCIMAVSVRLFIVFLELFGTMLMTGWGMIIAGALLFAILRMMREVQRYLVKRNLGGVNHA